MFAYAGSITQPLDGAAILVFRFFGDDGGLDLVERILSGKPT